MLILGLAFGLFTPAQEPSPGATPAAAEQQIAPHAMTGAQIAEANALTKPGKPSLHLKVHFQVFNLAGKPAEEGDLEYWWAGVNGSHLDITAPSLAATSSSDPANFSARRTRYLARQLLDNTLAPAAALGSSKLQTESEERVFGTIILECQHQIIKGNPPGSPVRYEVCSDPNTGNIRMIQGTGFSVVRNKPGQFGTTRLDMEVAISYGQVQAITGHITLLETFDPATNSVALEKPPAAGTSSTSTNEVLLGSVVAGYKISGAAPLYPLSARQQRIAGSVMLAAVISKEGKIDSLFPLSSPDALLTAAALDAVKTWTYRPYLLNGIPTEVSTSITVNFNLK